MEWNDRYWAGEFYLWTASHLVSIHIGMVSLRQAWRSAYNESCGGRKDMVDFKMLNPLNASLFILTAALL